MDKYIKDNTTFSAYRVFETLKFLMQAPASVPEIMQYLESLDINTDNEKNSSRAVVYKYLTTLKFAGIQIEKRNSKYEVVSMPFKINLEDDEQESLLILNEVLKITPEQKLSENIHKLFYQLNMSCSKNDILKEHQINVSDEPQKPTPEQVKLISKLEKYCSDNLKVNLTYKNINDEEITILCEPIEAKYLEKNVYFKCYNLNPTEFVEITSNQILKIEQSPSKCTRKYFANTTMFKLKGKLAKRYTLRSYERIVETGDPDTLTVANQEEPKEQLYLRLMRYGDLCEIVSSKVDRRRMKELINKTLENYIKT